MQGSNDHKKIDFLDTIPSEMIVYDEWYGPIIQNFEVEFKDEQTK